MTINLTAPDPEFKYKLAVPHASDPAGGQPGQGRGHEADPRHGRVLLRVVQPEQAARHEAQPVLQAVVDGRAARRLSRRDHESFGLTVEAQITAIENGQADWTLESPPADRLGEIGTKYASQVHINPLTAFWYLPMNVNIPPFNNVKARQAVNYAIDRNAAVQDLRRAEAGPPSCQVLPPGFPGYKPTTARTRRTRARRGRRPTSRRRRRSSRQSGTAGPEGRSRLVRRRGEQGDGRLPPERAQPDRLQGDASSRSPGTSSSRTCRTRRTRCRSTSQQWYQDYPAASDFLYILFGCESFHPGSDSSINIAGFCNKTINAQMHKALTARQSTNETAANVLWAKIDKQVTDQAPDGDAVHARSTSTSSRSASATSSSASSSTGWSTRRGSSRDRSGGRATLGPR